jgi:fido (protein-threonine AMPylation protein)
VLAAALDLDLLCIHPFRDGKGRVSRLQKENKVKSLGTGRGAR